MVTFKLYYRYQSLVFLQQSVFKAIALGALEEVECSKKKQAKLKHMNTAANISSFIWFCSEQKRPKPNLRDKNATCNVTEHYAT